MGLIYNMRMMATLTSSLISCNSRKLHSKQRSEALLQWLAENRVVEGVDEGGSERHKHHCPNKSDEPVLVLLQVGSAVVLDQIAQDFIILHLGNSSGLETAELLWATCSPLLGCPKG